MKIKHKDLANAVRFLSLDAVEAANSGHPGMPMGMADVATVLFKNFLRFNPKDPSWFNRDRFVLSAGHGSMLLYSLLYLTGYKSVSIDDIKNFRKLDCICAGHPEYHSNSGIETTTGPLGQGISNAVGFALAEEILKKRLGKKKIDHKTYVLAGDGCLMEGISHEALSFAGHIKLKNLILLFDNNSISIDGPTNLAVSDNTKKRFESYGWSYLEIDGHNDKQIFTALKKAQNSKKPFAISCKTTIGYGSPNKSGKASSHGSPLGTDEVKLVRKKLKWNYEPFKIPEKVLNEWRKIGENASSKAEKNKSYPPEFNIFNDEITSEIEQVKNNYTKSLEPIATRKSSEYFLDIVSKLPNLIGGSADLSGSVNTMTSSTKSLTNKDFSGRYIHYGVREHAMGAVMNGLTLHGGFIPYSGTFAVFADYMKGAMRLSALMAQRVIYVLTHDSIGLGEDGPTHQPIEQTMSLRLIPGLTVIRPADANETTDAWKIALENDGPTAILLTRQKLPIINLDVVNRSKEGLNWIEKQEERPDLILLGCGSEVALAINARDELIKEQITAQVVSIPSWELFKGTGFGNNDIPIITIEAGTTIGWSQFYSGRKGESIGIDRFGASAPGNIVMEKLGLSVKNIVTIAKKLLNK